MLGTNEIITKINTLISSGSLTQLQVTQLSAAVNSIEEKGVSSVSTAANLPDATLNTGRFFYIVDEARYVFSNGLLWDIVGIVAPAPVNLFSWGEGGVGELGDGTTVSKSSPVSVVGGYTDWTQVSAGRGHAVAIRSNGTAWAWGDAYRGKLGDNTVANKSSPVSVVGGFTDWIQVSAGGNHSLGLRSNGTAWAWGSNNVGQLGTGTGSVRSPVSVLGGYSDWIQLSAGFTQSLGVRADGTAWAWGNNARGQLGDNTVVNKTSPVSIVGGFTDWTQVSSARYHSLGLRANGTAWGWGEGRSGRLGDNTTLNKSSPVSVVGGFTDWTQVSAGFFSSGGIRADGTAWTWGSGFSGRLGDNTVVDKSSPVSVVGGFVDWIQISVGGQATLGLRANGTAWAWGNGSRGRLGNNDVTNRSSPVSVVGGFTDWVQVSSGNGHSAGIRG